MTYVLVLTFDNTEPMVFGPFDTPKEAGAYGLAEKIPELARDHHCTDCAVTRLHEPKR